jgi:ubiquinone/menaquinone biosynthesis C-methylase UbiE
MDDARQIAEFFDARASRYSTDEWHRRYAEQFVAVVPVRPGDVVLDAGTGTGFCARAIARRIGPSGRVIGVDLSARMLEQARSQASEANLRNIEYIEADACDLQNLSTGAFDAVLCSAGLLYMPVAKALREWRRLLKPGGTVAFSSTRQGSPSAGRVFRACAQGFGVSLADPSESLGTEERCFAALRGAGFDKPHAVAGRVAFETLDPELVWEANFRSPRHAATHHLTGEQQGALKQAFLRALGELMQEDPAGTGFADVIFATGYRDRDW